MIEFIVPHYLVNLHMKNNLLFLLITAFNMPDSEILKNEKELCEHLFYFLNNRSTPLRLCYRALLHGWSAQQFHQLCDDKAETVVLVKVGNWIFGGYTDQTWQGKNFLCQFFTSYEDVGSKAKTLGTRLIPVN